MHNVKRKKIFINASTVKISGGLIIALGYIETLSLQKNYDIYLSCPRIREYRDLENRVKSVFFVPDFILNRAFRWILDYFWLPAKIKRINPHIVLSLGNLPAITAFYQIYLHDNPYFTHGFPKELSLPLLKKLIHVFRVFFTKRRLKYVNEIWAQTDLEKRLIAEKINFSGHIKTVTPIIPIHLANRHAKSKIIPNKPTGSIRLICLSNYFEHKNIEILLDVVKLAAIEGFKLQIVFTIDSKTSKKSDRIVTRIKLLPNSQAINIGRVNSKNILPVINQCDGVILPSLMETFGLNCLDAWMSNKPYLISDKTFAREVCGEGAVFFNPSSPSDILEKIRFAYDNTEELKRLIEFGEQKISDWPTQESIIFQFDNAKLG